MKIDWHGVLPAVTTPFDAALGVDHPFLAKHLAWLIQHGCRAVVPLGSLGEGATLSFDERVAVLETSLRAAGERA
ncbi:MAG: dihydrodipicolinate synthase family protein, partial [bacterium]|nr:dihydrodipicolinate synthase family protein [bacterium]